MLAVVTILDMASIKVTKTQVNLPTSSTSHVFFAGDKKC